MAMQIISIGAVPSDGTGDPIRVSFDKTNKNFTEVYSTLATLTLSAPASSVGKTGDITGMMAVDSTYLYYCTGNFNGVTPIWQRQALTGLTW